MDDMVNNARRLELKSSSKGIVATCTSLMKRVRERMRNEVHELNERGSKLELVIIWIDINRRRVFDRPTSLQPDYDGLAL
jgi:gluconate kinase